MVWGALFAWPYAWPDLLQQSIVIQFLLSCDPPVSYSELDFVQEGKKNCWREEGHVAELDNSTADRVKAYCHNIWLSLVFMIMVVSWHTGATSASAHHSIWT